LNIETLERALQESILDAYRTTLPLDVWNKVKPFYELKPSVRDEILRRLFDFIPTERVKKAALVGSMASHHYNPETDIDVHVITDLTADTPEFDRFQERAEASSHRPLPGSRRPINFYIHETDDDFITVESAYDLIGDKWLKYTPLKQVNIRDYYDAFKSIITRIDADKAELYRDLVDYAELKAACNDVPSSEIDKIEGELEVKLREINNAVDKLINRYKELKAERTLAYLKQIELGNFNKAREASSTDVANVVYKMLERYSYTELLRAIKRFKKEKGEIKHDDVKDVAKVVSTSIHRSIEDRLDSKLAKI